jgi:hypothetical protein
MKSGRPGRPALYFSAKIRKKDRGFSKFVVVFYGLDGTDGFIRPGFLPDRSPNIVNQRVLTKDIN